MSKYIELLDAIAESEEIGSSVHYGVKLALKYLDKHPDQVPGRTITLTESQVEAIGRDAVNYFTPGGTWADWARAVFMSADFPVVPDPEPTNAEKLAADLREIWDGYQTMNDVVKWLNDNDWVKADG